MLMRPSIVPGPSLCTDAVIVNSSPSTMLGGMPDNRVNNGGGEAGVTTTEY